MTEVPFPFVIDNGRTILAVREQTWVELEFNPRLAAWADALMTSLVGSRSWP
jgi:hypothetical protein